MVGHLLPGGPSTHFGPRDKGAASAVARWARRVPIILVWGEVCLNGYRGFRAEPLPSWGRSLGPLLV